MQSIFKSFIIILLLGIISILILLPYLLSKKEDNKILNSVKIKQCTNLNKNNTSKMSLSNKLSLPAKYSAGDKTILTINEQLTEENKKQEILTKLLSSIKSLENIGVFIPTDNLYKYDSIYIYIDTYVDTKFFSNTFDVYTIEFSSNLNHIKFTMDTTNYIIYSFDINPIPSHTNIDFKLFQENFANYLSLNINKNYRENNNLVFITNDRTIKYTLCMRDNISISLNYSLVKSP